MLKPMEELEDIDALINDVVQVEKRENGRTAAQIKIKTFANNFANIGNIGEEQRKTEDVGQTILRRDGRSGGETALGADVGGRAAPQCCCGRRHRRMS